MSYFNVVTVSHDAPQHNAGSLKIIEGNCPLGSPVVGATLKPLCNKQTWQALCSLQKGEQKEVSLAFTSTGPKVKALVSRL